MKTFQDVIPNPIQRDEIACFMINNTQARTPVGVDRYGRPVLQVLRFPNHGKFAQLLFVSGGKKMKKNFIPWK